ncbi:hypothetical protein DOQ08_02745 [Marinobacter litoralis]|uniref:Uncharacterized protein n=1 Tax=Marinobacter litoralis TaxID=187981 RepID=A0A3M2R9I3_9GAMM|nr:hypothetical protein [Marinobacter litoralis]RMJ01956.1 hypothetical protein DOQ08_02745 [Marinobacter litoralis]
MRADLSSRTCLAGRLAGVALIALVAAGCKTEKDPDQPTLLGSPAPTAYLGVEYYYNWGAYGGEDILDYSLVNAPSWLALEDTSNKARQGIIMRGVPGLSGGNRGDADLGKTTNIEIVTTDGKMAGFQPFDIEVKPNVMSIEVDEFTEGEAANVAQKPNTSACAVPDLSTPGKHSFDLNTYQDDGAFEETVPVDSTTYRTYAKVTLEKPSVTRIHVAFELDSDFDPENCDAGVSAPHQKCEYGTSNTGRAIVGQDIVVLGSASDKAVDKEGKPLTYITYQQNNANVYDRGVLTFEPGITECYIPLEVVDDRIPEPSELAFIRLTEVREGIASLGAKNTGTRAGITILDNEPVVTVQTMKGGAKDAINADDNAAPTIYKALLTGERDGPVMVRFAEQSKGSGAQKDTHFEIVDVDGSPVTELVFPEEQDEIEFGIRGKAYSLSADDGYDDLFLNLAVDDAYQAGRQGYARAVSDSLLRVNLNRLITAQTFTDFTPTDIALGHASRLFVAGYTDTDAEVRIYDQAGMLLDTVTVAAAVTNTDIHISVAERVDSTATPRVTYQELAVGYSAPGSKGGQDVFANLYRFDGSDYLPVWGTAYETGSSEDDFVRWVGLSADRSKPLVVLAGNTAGSWSDQNNTGGTDVFLVEIEDDAGAPKEQAVRIVGSGADDQLAAGDLSASAPVLFGQAPMTLNGTSTTGPFFATGRANTKLNVVQVGADASEILRHGIYASGLLWLVGDSGGISYAVTEVEDEDNELTRSRNQNSQAGFVWGLTGNGEPRFVYQVNDYADASSETLTQSLLFDGDIVLAGNTDGQLDEDGAVATSNDGILARRSSEDSLAYRNWNTQIPRDMSFLDMVNYRDDEVMSLVDVAGERQLLVFSPEGRLLTPVAP